MKKLVLISVCVLSLAFTGRAATSSSRNDKNVVKKEAPVAKKDTKKATAKKTGAKKVAVSPVTPATPIKK